MGTKEYDLTSKAPLPPVVPNYSAISGGNTRGLKKMFQNNNMEQEHTPHYSAGHVQSDYRRSDHEEGGDSDRGCHKSYNRFAAISPASKPANAGISNYNFSYIKAQGQENKPTISVSSWQDRNRNVVSPSSNRGRVIQEMKAKINSNRTTEQPEFVGF